MLLNPHRFGGASLTDPLISFVKLGINFTGTNGQTTATDFSGSPHALTFVGNAQISTADSTFGAGSSLLFDGTGDYITSPDSPDWTPGASVDFCWEGVLKPRIDFAANTDIVSQAVGSGTYPYRIYRLSGANGGIGVLMFDASASLIANVTGGNLVTGAWTHWAVIRDGGTLRIKIGGVQVASSSIGTAALFSTTGDLQIGLYNATAAFDGRTQSLRYTLGNPRYGGAGSFAPPSGLFPTT